MTGEPYRHAGHFKKGDDPRRVHASVATIALLDGTGKGTAYRRRQRELVAQIGRRIFPPEKMLEWLHAIVHGKDPDAEDGKGHEPISVEVRLAAWSKFAAYTLGMPAQSIQLEGQLASIVAHVQAKPGGRVIEQVAAGAELGRARAAAREELERLHRQRAALEVDADGVIDADSSDVP